MRKSIVGAIFTLLAISLFGLAEASNEVKMFPVKSGHIEYELSGTSKGKKTVYFDEYGDLYYELLEQNTSVTWGKNTITDENRSLTIRNGEYTYSIDLKENSGTKIKNEEIDGMKNALTSGMSQKDMEKMGKEMLEQLGGRIVGNENFLGRECEVVEVMGSKVWLYKKTLPLKSEMSMMGVENLEVATLFKENVSIPASKFSVPKGIEIKEISIEGMGEPEGKWQEIQEMSLSYERFDAAMEKVRIKGYNKVRGESEPGEFYGAVFMDEESRSVYIQVTPLSNFSGYDGGDGVSVEKQFQIKGEAAAYCSYESDEGKSNLLFLEVPSEDVMMTVISSTPRSMGELVKIAEQVKF